MLWLESGLTHKPPPPVVTHSPQVFSKVGDVKRIVMGLDKHKLTPCGFCFVVGVPGS